MPVAGDERVDITGATTQAPGSGYRDVDAVWEPIDGVEGVASVGFADVDPGPDRSILRPMTQAEEPPAEEPQQVSQPVVGAIPVALSIPSIGVLSTVVPTGLTAERAMEVPGVDESGWYRHGVTPGSAYGSSVLAAHVDFNGRPGVFQRLGEVQLDDEVVVADADGVSTTFRVTERYQVDKGQLPTDELFRRSGSQVLTLITCGGGFSDSERSYTDNIVVRAVPV